MSAERHSDGLLRVLLIVLAVVVLLPALTMALAMPMMATMGGWGGTAGVHSPLWSLLMLLFWLLVLGGVGYLVYRAVAGDVASSASRDPALEELRLAYARGDLSDEEFEERREKLARDR